MAGAALGGVLVFGAALVSKSTSPHVSRNSLSSDAVGDPAGNSAKFSVISHGESVNLSDHVDSGDQYTVFLFGADW